MQNGSDHAKVSANAPLQSGSLENFVPSARGDGWDRFLKGCPIAMSSNRTPRQLMLHHLHILKKDAWYIRTMPHRGKIRANILRGLIILKHPDMKGLNGQTPLLARIQVFRHTSPQPPTALPRHPRTGMTVRCWTSLALWWMPIQVLCDPCPHSLHHRPSSRFRDQINHARPTPRHNHPLLVIG